MDYSLDCGSDYVRVIGGKWSVSFEQSPVRSDNIWLFAGHLWQRCDNPSHVAMFLLIVWDSIRHMYRWRGAMLPDHLHSRPWCRGLSIDHYVINPDLYYIYVRQIWHTIQPIWMWSHEAGTHTGLVLTSILEDYLQHISINTSYMEEDSFHSYPGPPICILFNWLYLKLHIYINKY